MFRLEIADSAEVRHRTGKPSGTAVPRVTIHKRAGESRKFFPAHLTSVAAATLGSLFLVLLTLPADAGGLTFITHGLNGNTDGWVTGMANRITNYARFPGTNATIYKAYFYSTNSGYALTATRIAGSVPSASDCGELILKFDWSQLAGGSSYNTYQIAAVAAPALLSTNFISELGGHALAELPLHLVGHSRGGSLISELSRLLGTNGVWVDHLTTLDPHPLNNDGFNDALLYSAVDAPARTYANVLFHDNYWQNIDSFVHGEAVSGAYVRKLTSLSGGYGSGIGNPHSNVHLWYHGTLDWRVPASDTEASITITERTNWWSGYESRGTNAGFDYSLIGGADRLSSAQPLGSGTPMIRDGYNQVWNFGAGTISNRTALTTNYGNWPSIIKFNRTQTNSVGQGQTTPISFYYQWARPTNNVGSISIYLDDDLNPWNNNQKLLAQIPIPATGSPNFIGAGGYNVPLAASNAAPGWHSLLAVISAGGKTRYLYAPELVQVVVSQAPVLDITRINASQIQIGIDASSGQTIILQSSSNLLSWQPLATNTLSTSRWNYTNNPVTLQFYRALLSQ
jgi:hypothetical protein